MPLSNLRAKREPFVLWRWRVRDALTGRRYIIRYHLDEATALERYGADAEKLEWTAMTVLSLGEHTGVIAGGPYTGPTRKSERESGEG